MGLSMKDVLIVAGLILACFVFHNLTSAEQDRVRAYYASLR